MSMLDGLKRITIVTGHFGSGKTEFALNYALKLREAGKDVLMIDFDIVNPYYRTKDAEEYLKSRGIEVIAPGFANSNIETPTLPPEIMRAFDDKSKYIIFDAGGDDDGAVPLGVYREHFAREDYDMFFVLNERRMLTQDVDGAFEIFSDILGASRLEFTGVVNNTHLMGYTDEGVIIRGEKLAEEFSKKVGLPLVCTCVSRGTIEKIGELPKLNSQVFTIDLFVGPGFSK